LIVFKYFVVVTTLQKSVLQLPWTNCAMLCKPAVSMESETTSYLEFVTAVIHNTIFM